MMIMNIKKKHDNNYFKIPDIISIPLIELNQLLDEGCDGDVDGVWSTRQQWTILFTFFMILSDDNIADTDVDNKDDVKDVG